MDAPGRRSALALLSMLGASIAAAQTPVCMDSKDLSGIIYQSGGRLHAAVNAQAGTIVLTGSFYGFKGVPNVAWDVWDSGYLGGYGGDRQAATNALANGLKNQKAYATIVTTAYSSGEMMGFLDVPSGTCP